MRVHLKLQLKYWMQKHDVKPEKCKLAVFLTKVHKEDFPLECQRDQTQLKVIFGLIPHFKLFLLM
jgi:hypothetical protein